MDELVEQALKKALPKLRDNPKLALGYGGVSLNDVADMRIDKRLMINHLIAGNRLFEIKHTELDLTKKEGDSLRSYLQHEAANEKGLLRQKFSYLI